MATASLPDRARVVIIGGGVIGTSVAYHLAKLGVTDVVLLEQGRLSCGTTWHAAGLVGQLRASESATRLVQYSAELYAGLEAETGLATGYRNVGGVIVARTEDRMVQLRRTAANAAAYANGRHPTYPESASRSSGITKAEGFARLCASWNEVLETLEGSVTPDTAVEPSRYGITITDAELAPIPACDLPPGLPPWMGALDAWAVRTGDTKQMKRASITVSVPTAARTWPPVPG